MKNNNRFTSADVEIVKKEILYKGVFCLTRLTLKQKLFEGGWSEVYSREVLERRSAAGILPYDPILDKVILIEQFRPGSLADPESPWLIEIPAGILNPNDTPADTARSEAHEEAGCHILDLIPIYEYYVSPGGATEFISLFCGRVDATDIHGIHGLKHEQEDIRVINISFQEAIAKLQVGEIKTSPAIIALLWLQVNRDDLRRRWK